MIPKFHSRTIGGVSIYEIHGDFSEPWVSQVKEKIKETEKGKPVAGLLFNVREVDKVDRPGAETILATVREARKRGILGQNIPDSFIAEHMNPNEPIPIFEQGREAIGYFGKEFAQEGRNLTEERRRFPRIKTALAAELEPTHSEESFLFETVITNLSEGGLYGYFLDSRAEELAERALDPFDLKMLKIKLSIGKEKWVELQGKLLRTERPFSEGVGFAVEFYDVQPEAQREIRAFLKEAGEKEEQKND